MLKILYEMNLVVSVIADLHFDTHSHSRESMQALRSQAFANNNSLLR